MEIKLPKINFPPYEQHGVHVSGYKEMSHISFKDVTQSDSIGGHTHIDRYPRLMKNIANVCDYLHNAANRSIKILFAPCSVGYEPLSFARELHERGKLKQDFAQIHALDRNENFLKCAGEFAIPLATLDAPRLRNWLPYLDVTDKAPNAVVFTPEITQHIRFEAPQDLCEHEHTYDAVVMMNLVYNIENDQEKRRILSHAFQKADSVLILDKYSYTENPLICHEAAQENGFILLNKAMHGGCYGPTPKQLFDNLQATFIRADLAKDLSLIMRHTIENERARVYGKDTLDRGPF